MTIWDVRELIERLGQAVRPLFAWELAYNKLGARRRRSHNAFIRGASRRSLSYRTLLALLISRDQGFRRFAALRAVPPCLNRSRFAAF